MGLEGPGSDSISNSLFCQMTSPEWYFRTKRTTSMQATSRSVHTVFSVVLVGLCIVMLYLCDVCVCLLSLLACLCIVMLFVCVSQVMPPGSGVCLRYIAAQGPLPQTCTHFWQSVWEHHTHTIIMLTTLTERGRVCTRTLSLSKSETHLVNEDGYSTHRFTKVPGSL